MQLIIFKLKDNFYGFTTENIDEITTKIEATMIPQGPAWTSGLINLRGQIMTLIDLEKLLNDSSTSQELWYNNTIIVNTQDNLSHLWLDRSSVFPTSNLKLSK